MSSLDEPVKHQQSLMHIIRYSNSHFVSRWSNKETKSQMSHVISDLDLAQLMLVTAEPVVVTTLKLPHKNIMNKSVNKFTFCTRNNLVQHIGNRECPPFDFQQMAHYLRSLS